MIKLLISKITDPFFLMYELLLSNRKIIIPTIVGLIIALVVISNSSVLIESYRQEIFEEIVFTDDEYSLKKGDISVDIWASREYEESDIISKLFSNFSRFNNYINRSSYRANYNDYISDYLWYNNFDCAIWVNETEKYGGEDNNKQLEDHTEIYTSSKTDYYDQIESILGKEDKGRLPETSSEIILLRPKGEPVDEWQKDYEKKYENFTLNSKINFTIPKWNIGDQQKQFNITLTIVGIIEYERYSRYYYYEDYYRQSSEYYTDNGTRALLEKYLSNFYDEYLFLTKPTYLKNLIEDLIAPYSYVEISGGVSGKIYLERKHFNAFNVNGEKYRLQRFILTLEQELNDVSYYPSIWSRIFDNISQYQATIFGLLIILLLVSLPVICIALYLVIYSFGLIRKQKQEQIGIIKTRGGSWLQIIIILLGEVVISTIIAVFIGFIISIFLADIVMRSTDYLEFLGMHIPVRATISMLQTLITWGILFALLLNFVRIIRMSRQKITDTLIPTETKDPFWKRYYIDVIIFVIGTCTWIILMEITKNPPEYDDGNYALFSMFYMILALLGIPAPFFLFFGTIMVIARAFPFIMRKLAELSWKVEGGISSFSIRNVVRHKQAANRAVLLITLAMSFSILSSSLVFSLDETQRIKYYYSQGADIALSESGYINETALHLLEENVSHLSSITTAYLTYYHSEGYISKNYHFLFIDPISYSETAFHESWFKLSGSFSDLMVQLSDNSTILLFRGNLKEDISKPSIGDNMSFHFTNITDQINQYSFRIGGTFKYWTMLFPEKYYDYTRHYWIIGSIGMFKKLNQSRIFTSQEITGKYLAKVDSLNNIENIVEEIYNVTEVVPTSPALQYKEYKTSFTRRFSLSILNSDLIVCLAIVIVGVIMFAFFTYLERGKEIGVERSLGMTRFQTLFSFLVEAGLIIAFGTIIGILTGMYFVTMFLQITQFGETIPPSMITYPITLLVQMIIWIFVVAGIGTSIPAYMATRKDISRILKVE